MIVLPATTLAGPPLVAETSTAETVTVNDALSFSLFESTVAELTAAMLLNWVPEPVPGGMCPVSVSVALAPDGNVAAVHVIVPPEPPAGVVHESAGPEFCTSETNVMVPGSGSVSENAVASSGPALPVVIVYTTSVSGPAAFGPTFVTNRSACVVGGTNVAAAPELFSSFGSNVALETVAMLVKNVLGGVAGSVWNVNVNVAVVLVASVAIVQFTLPAPPIAGVVQLKAGPEFCVADTNVMPAGSGSSSTAVMAASGPPLVMVRSNATSASAVVVAGAVWATPRSAVVPACAAAAATSALRTTRSRTATRADVRMNRGSLRRAPSRRERPFYIARVRWTSREPERTTTACGPSATIRARFAKTGRAVKRIGLLLLIGLAGAARAAAPPDEAARLVERFRETIAVTDGEAALDPVARERVRALGKLLFHEQLALRAQLAARLAAPAEVDAFLDYLEHDLALHDADKLALREVVEDLVAAPQEAARARRLRDDQQALAAIQARYEKEMAAVLAAVGARAIAVKREAWDAYLAFIRSKYSRDALLKRYQADLDAMQGDARGGGAGESEIETFGLRLPPKTVVLTFDDGPHPRYTDRILEILKHYGLTGVFFEVGQNVGRVDAEGKPHLEKGAQISRRILDEGSTLANHSFTHANLPKLDAKALDSEIDQTETLLREIKPDTPPLFRPPYGARNAKVLGALKEKSLRSIQWNIDSEDWADPIPASVADRVIKETERQGRGIILFHDIHDRAVNALPTVIDALTEKGYKFASWSGDDFHEIVPTPGDQVAARGAAAAANAAAATRPYRESWAVVIGVDAYASWPKLSYAVHDAKGVAEVLTSKYGFPADHVFTLYDAEATREHILTLLGDKLGDPNRVQHDDRVLVFYAGHGATRHLASGRDLGYIIPVDADLANYQGKAISMSNFQDIAEAIPAKHVLFVMDSCYSGLALTRGAGAPPGRNYLQEISRRGARQMFTAGGADQQVADGGPNGHSIFTWTFLRALDGEGDLNGDGMITASELAAFAAPVVSSMSHQTPAFGNMPGSAGGEFLFELKPGAAPLNELSARLDAEGEQMGSELAKLKAEIEKKSQRNSAMAEQLAAARTALAKLEDGGAQASGAATRSAVDVQAAIDRNESGMQKYAAHDFQSALGDFVEAAKLDPGNALAANNVGFVYFKLGQIKDSIDWYERTLKIDPLRAVAWLNVADAYALVERKADAIAAYKKFLELKPASKQAEDAARKLAALEGASAG